MLDADVNCKVIHNIILYLKPHPLLSLSSDSEKETYDRMLREVLDDDYVDPTRDVAHQTKLAQQFRAKFTGAPPSESSANYGGAK